MRAAIDVMIDRARVLASPMRVNIWCSVGAEGVHPMELARQFGIAASTVTYHLSVLRRAKLVEVVGGGQWRVYRWTSQRLAIVTEREFAALHTAPGAG